MAESASYSLREAAYVVDLPFDRLEKASERGEVLTSTRLVKGRKVRVVPKKELVLFRYSLDHRQELPKTSWSTVQARFRAHWGAQIVPVGAREAKLWGQLLGAKEKNKDDIGLIATAKLHGWTLVTRNIDHCAGYGVRLLDPFRNARH